MRKFTCVVNGSLRVKSSFYKCPRCRQEHEVFYENGETPAKAFWCEKCGGVMLPFNFKNNGSRWYYCDKK